MQKVPNAPQNNGAKDIFIMPKSGISIIQIGPIALHFYAVLSSDSITRYIFLNLAKYFQYIVSRLDIFVVNPREIGQVSMAKQC